MWPRDETASIFSRSVIFFYREQHHYAWTFTCRHSAKHDAVVVHSFIDMLSITKIYNFVKLMNVLMTNIYN